MPDRARGLVPFQFDRHVRWGRLPIGAVVPVSSHAGSPRPMTQTPRAAATQELRRHYEPIVARLVNSDWTVWSLKPMDRTCSRVHAWPVRTPYEVPNRMSNDEINRLARELVRVRRNLAAEAPYSPAWTATVEWCDDLESQVRSLGMDPDALARSALSARSRQGRAHSSLTCTDRFAASAE